MDNPPPHPLFARTFGELGIRYLVASMLARLLEAEDQPTSSPKFRENLAKIESPEALLRTMHTRTLLPSKVGALKGRPELDELLSSLPVAGSQTSLAEVEAVAPRWVKQMGKLLLELVGNSKFLPNEALERQLGAYEAGIRNGLATIEHGLRKLRGESLRIDLPAAILPRNELPPRSVGSIDLYEVADFADPAARSGHTEVFDALGELTSSVCWRLVHGKTGRSALSRPAALLAESVAELAPEQFWPAVERLYRSYLLVDAAELPKLLHDLPLEHEAVVRNSQTREVEERVDRDQAMVMVCAVPARRPSFVIGRRIFIGRECVEELRAEIQRLHSRSTTGS